MSVSPPGTQGLTPRSIRHAEFTTRQRGFSREEVSDFLAEVADAWSETIQENKDLHRRLTETREAAKQAMMKEQEARAELERARASSNKASDISAQNMQATVVLTRAQEMADQLVSHAQAEAEQLVNEASNVESIDFVRTYAKITHDQMRAVVSELGRQLDLLGDLANKDNRAATWKALQH